MTIILDWFGPYESLYKVAPGKSLVSMSGKEPYKRKAKIYHLGICANASEAARKVPTVQRERRYWYCEVAYAPVLLPNVLELAERVLSPTSVPAQPMPTEPLTFVMRYFKANRTPRAARPSFHGGRPDVLHWDGRRWWGGKGLFSPPA